MDCCITLSDGDGGPIGYGRLTQDLGEINILKPRSKECDANLEDSVCTVHVNPQIREQMSVPDLYVVTVAFLALKKWFF